MVQTNDGFEIAGVDLKLRGQVDIVKDNDILKTARYHAMQLLKEDPALDKPENLVIRHAYSQLVRYKNIWNYIS